MTEFKSLIFSEVRIQGHFLIKADKSLEETANVINEILNLNLEKEVTGYFEEFPAFDCTVLGINFALLGIPELEYRMPDYNYEWYNFQIQDQNDYKTDIEINFGTNLVFILNSKSDLICKEDWNENHYINRCINIKP
jgi:hypothetical protein